MGNAKGNGTEACRLAGYKGSDGVLGVIANRLLKKAKILSKIAQAKEKAGLTDDRLLEKHLELLYATKIQSAVVYTTIIDGIEKRSTESKNDFVEVPDKRVQLGALQLAYELKGQIRRKIEHMGQITTEKKILLIAADPEALEQYRKRKELELNGTPT